MLNSILADLCYESLLEIHPDTLRFGPGLATHWKISADQRTFSFRIHPHAKWSDGRRVTAADVVATYRLLTDDTLLDPMTKASLSKIKPPVAKSKLIVEFACTKDDWRNLIALANMKILPAHQVDQLGGRGYLRRFNMRHTAVSGPYILRPRDIRAARSISLSRRKDYWARDATRNKGRYNFDTIRFNVVSYSQPMLERVLAGELDFMPVYTARTWVEQLPRTDAVKLGHLIRQKIYTRAPQGFQGLALNMRRAPLDDVRVRKALAHLYDRKSMVKKFAYNEYLPLKSYFPGGDAENLKNKMVEFDPRAAAKLLAQAGWKKRGADGILTKDGKRLSLALSYRSRGTGKYYRVYQQAAKQAGVEINLQLQSPELHWKTIVETRGFDMAGMAWGAILFPNPRANYHSSMAARPGSNNITAIANDKIDQLIKQYESEFDPTKRNKLLRSLDGELFHLHPYVLDWYLPSQRILYWRKFGMPSRVFAKHEDWSGAFAYWWVDAKKEKTLSAARKNQTALKPVPPLKVGWLDSPSQPKRGGGK